MSYSVPHFRDHGTARQLVVRDEPFLIIGGELHNSSASCPRFLESVWPQLQALNVNTALAPVYWELLEPEEGQFDFALVDKLIMGARQHDLHLILLWFGTWKNGMSSYAPGWMKRDHHRFHRIRDRDDVPLEIISPLSEAALAADRKAFTQLMEHLRKVDGESHTVIMVQVQNEVGVLGASRDFSPAANAAFATDVPAELMETLIQREADLFPALRNLWHRGGRRSDGTWANVFGTDEAADEAFMAWHYARFIQSVAAAGKSAYPLPLFANAWLSSLDAEPAQWASGGLRPGEWPSGGPLPHTLDIWMMAAPALRLFAPDIYQPQFADWCEHYTHRGNPLFIPEMPNTAEAARLPFLPIGEFHGLGTSPFGIDAVPPDAAPLIARSHEVLRQTAPLILQHQGSPAICGFLLDEETPEVVRHLNGMELTMRLDTGFGQAATRAGGLIIAESAESFLGIGFGFQVSFRDPTAADSRIGIESIEEGRFANGVWVAGRRLNGDEAGRGHVWRFLDFTSPGDLPANRHATGISRCRVYPFA